MASRFTDQHWHSYGDALAVSSAIERRLKWMRAFRASDDPIRDVEHFLVASGSKETMARTLEAGGSLLDSAERIMANHEAELRRIDRGAAPRWFARDRDRLPLYTE